MFNRPFDTTLRERFALLAQIGSLAATGVFMWLTAVGPRLDRYTLSSVLGHAFLYALLAWGWSAAITLGLFLAARRGEPAGMLSATLRTSTAAVWFAPAVFLLMRFSPAALAAALVLVVSATRLLYSEWRRIRDAGQPPDDWTPPRGMFGEDEPPRPLLLRELAPALLVSACLQCGVIAIGWHYPLLAAALLTMCAALITAFAISAGAIQVERAPTLPRSVLGAVLTVALATGLTVGGMSGRLARHRVPNDSQPDLVDTVRALLRLIFYGEQPPGTEPLGDLAKSASGQQDKGSQPPKLPETAGVVPDGSYPGVILWPEIKPVPRLVAPLPELEGGWFHGPHSRPLTIPFGGEYWMYRWAYRRPPPNSFFERGSPAALSFSTTDHRPLMMEAWQKLDQPIDLRCCSKVQVVIWNADLYPGTVRLDLFAFDGDSPDAGSVKLGSAPVKSAPDLSREPVTAVPETLEFRISPEMPIQSCSRFKVVFDRAGSRMYASARVAIERFVLVP